MARLWPQHVRGEGHFVALLRNTADTPVRPLSGQGLTRPSRISEAVAHAFLQQLAPTAQFGETLVALPAYPDLRGIKLLRAGLHLGTARERRFIPDHALAMAGALDLPMISLSEAELALYLHGDTLPGDGLPSEMNGYLYAACQNVPLGFIKAAGGMLKNHYPKRLRRNTHSFTDLEVLS